VDLFATAARDRHRRVALSAGASAAARGISVATTLVSVPIVLGYLGEERYGLWVTITSLTIGLSILDLGLGNGLVNAVAEAHGRDDPALARRYVSSAFFLLTGISLALALIFLSTHSIVPWARVFNATSPAAEREAAPAMAVFMSCLIATVPISVAQRVQAGYQRGFDNSLWQAAASLIGLTALLAGVWLQFSLPSLILAFSGPPLLTGAIQAGLLFGWRHRELRPRWREFSAPAAGKIFRLGGLFFVLQLAATLAFASDNLVAAQVLGAASVAEYSVTMQLFSVPMLILGTLFLPLWPAYGEALTRGDVSWVLRTLKRSLLIALVVAGLPSVALVVFGRSVVQWWAGPLVAAGRCFRRRGMLSRCS
jgi:O-antigen/teichoic acid export membrane protein